MRPNHFLACIKASIALSHLNIVICNTVTFSHTLFSQRLFIMRYSRGRAKDSSVPEDNAVWALGVDIDFSNGLIICLDACKTHQSGSNTDWMWWIRPKVWQTDSCGASGKHGCWSVCEGFNAGDQFQDPYFRWSGQMLKVDPPEEVIRTWWVI